MIKKALNHILAHSIDIYNFRAGYDEDWSSVANIPGGEGRTCKMFNHIYLEVRQMLERGEIDVGDVVVIFRIWSFQGGVTWNQGTFRDMQFL